MIDRLFVGVITGEYARRADFYDYLDVLEKPPGTVGWKCHDRSPAKGRNLIVAMARKHGCSHILFLDDDMVPRPNVIGQLAEHDKDIVSGLYLGRSAPHIPFVFSHFEPEGAYARGLNRDDPRLVPIAAAGMGCCLVRMTVFDRLDPPYFRLGELLRSGLPRRAYRDADRVARPEAGRLAAGLRYQRRLGKCVTTPGCAGWIGVDPALRRMRRI